MTPSPGGLGPMDGTPEHPQRQNDALGGMLLKLVKKIWCNRPQNQCQSPDLELRLAVNGMVRRDDLSTSCRLGQMKDALEHQQGQGNDSGGMFWMLDRRTRCNRPKNWFQNQPLALQLAVNAMALGDALSTSRGLGPMDAALIPPQ